MTMASGPAFRALADDTGREFGGSTFRVEECQFLGRDGVVDWTIRSSKCALLVSGSAVCDVCDGPLKHNLWARSSYHNNGGKALKVDPNSKAALHLISSDLLRQRLATETMLRKNSEAREEALALRIEQLQPVDVNDGQHKSFTELLKALHSTRQHITTDDGAVSPTLDLLMVEQMKRIENKRAKWHPLILKWALSVYHKGGVGSNSMDVIGREGDGPYRAAHQCAHHLSYNSLDDGTLSCRQPCLHALADVVLRSCERVGEEAGLPWKLLGELRARLRRELHRRGMLLRGSCFRRGHLYPPSIYSSIPSGRGYPCCLQGLGPLHLRPELRQPILFLRWDWEWRRTLEQRSCERRRELPHIVIHPRLTRPRPRPNPSRRRHLEPPAQAQLIWDVLSAPQAAGVPKNKFSDATMQRGGVNPRQRSRLQDAEVGEGCSRTCRSRLLSR
jgi:hypothetical protein